MTRPRDPLTGLPGEVVVLEDHNRIADHAARWLSQRSTAQLVAGGGRAFTVALAGGSTPEALYRLLARTPHREQIDWAGWQVFFGDERACPPDDAESNYAMARRTLLDHVPVPEQHVHRMPAEQADLDAAARTYAALLEHLLPPAAEGAPQFDCVLLGLGDDGHTASLFPGTAALEVTDAWVTRGRADYQPYDRMTLTYPTINAARAVVFVVSGEGKRDALHAVRAGNAPASRVDPVHGELCWFVDRAAVGER